MAQGFRQSPRAPLDIYLNKVIGNSLFMCRASNISQQGIYLSKLIEPQYEGAEVGLEFALPGGEEILWARGKIVRDGRLGECHGIGIRFTVIPERFRGMIGQYVDRHELGAESMSRN